MVCNIYHFCFIGLPPELYCIWEAYPWRFGEPFCIFKAFLTEMTSYSSVLTITAFTIERYIAICHPIKSQTLSNLSRAVKIIMCIWVVAAAFAVPYPIYTRVYHYIRVNNTVVADSLICSIAPPWRDLMIHVFQMSTFVFFVLPMTMITIMYVLIGRTLSTSDFGTPVCNSSSSTKSKARKAVIKMLGKWWSALSGIPNIRTHVPNEYSFTYSHSCQPTMTEQLH